MENPNPDNDNTGQHRRRFLQHVSAGLAAATFASTTASAGHNPEDDQGTTASPDELLDRMTLDEKIHMVHGHAYEFNPTDEDVTGYIPPIPRLDIPDVKMSDGPVGVRHNEATAFPAGISQASTFDRTRLHEVGVAMGRESKAKDQDVLLAPGLNIVRVPTLGRAFEYFGEDPYLASRMTVATVSGIQSTGTIATPKHYVANNQEGEPIVAAGEGFASTGTAARRGSRQYVSAEVGERALKEIYLPAFKAAVQEADAASVMAAYNRINGEYASQHRQLLRAELKRGWDFDGYVVSDWGATRSTVNAAKDGLDVEMPYGAFFGEPLKRAVQSGVVSEETLEDKVRRVLEQMDRFGILAGERIGPAGAQNTDAHQQLAREVAAEGAVLLQNTAPGSDADPVLPIDVGAIESLAVIGHEIDQATVGGGGSSDVTPPYSVSPLEAIRNRTGTGTRVRWTRAEDSTTEAVSVAEASEVALVFAQGSSTEGHDREDMVLDGNQNQLIADVAAANDRTVVVLNTGAPVTMPWVERVPTILQMWYPGMEDGNATADVLFGTVNPGGKLPVTFGRQFADYPANTEQQYPGLAGRAEYSEGVFVGYRHFDANDIEPLFPFGHGRSYTDIVYDSLQVSPRMATPDHPIDIGVTVRNVGDRQGSEAVQVYVHDVDASVPRPPNELAAFEKIQLAAGEAKRVRFSLDKRAFAFYEPTRGTWIVEPGRFNIRVGASSRDIRLTQDLTITEHLAYGHDATIPDRPEDVAESGG